MDDSRKGLEAYGQAHQIAFAPLTFQAVRVALDRGILATLQRAGKAGRTRTEIAADTGFSLYAARVLLEGCLSVDVVALVEGEPRYRLTQTGFLLLRDPLVRANMRFVNDVCYRGAVDLERSLDEGRPAGLGTLGPWSTIYEGLSELPPAMQESWFGLDHLYSDAVFAQLLSHLLARRPRSLLDVGGNTGKWAVLCATSDPDIEITIVDHPGQLQKALARATGAGVEARVRGEPMDLLDHARPFPAGFDVVWMSQLLDCFPETDIVRILRRGAEALSPTGTLYVLESYWDRQSNEVGRNVVTALSLYFACMANGTSRMYHSDDLRECVSSARLTIVEELELGTHTLFACRPKSA